MLEVVNCGAINLIKISSFSALYYISLLHKRWCDWTESSGTAVKWSWRFHRSILWVAAKRTSLAFCFRRACSGSSCLARLWRLNTNTSVRFDLRTLKHETSAHSSVFDVETRRTLNSDLKLPFSLFNLNRRSISPDKRQKSIQTWNTHEL